MAEKESPVEVVKVLGKRRLCTGVEYLVQRKENGKEEWVPYRLLHNSKDLVKEYNIATKCNDLDHGPGMANGINLSLPDNTSNIQKKPRKQQVRRQSFPLASNSVAGKIDRHSMSSHEIICGNISPSIKSVDESQQGPVCKKAKLSQSPGNDFQSPSTTLNDHKVTKMVTKLIETSCNTSQIIVGETAKIKKVMVSKTTSPSTVDKQGRVESKSAKTNGSEVKKVRRKKKIMIAAETSSNTKPSNDLEVTKDLLQAVLSKVTESQRKKDNPQSKRKQKPVTRKNVSKLVKKTMQFNRTKFNQSNSMNGKSETNFSFSILKNPQVQKTELKKKENGRQKSKKLVNRQPNKGKALVVKLAAIGALKKKSGLLADGNSASSRNSSTVTSDSEGMLYSIADVSSLSTSDSDSDDEGQNGTSDKRQPVLSKKKLVLKLTDLKHEIGSTTGTPDSDNDSEITFKHVPHRLLLKDSVRPKSKSVKPVSKSSVLVKPMSKLVQSPQSSTVVPSICQTPPRTQREPSPSLGSTNDLPRIPPVIPILPTSPSPPRYDMLVKNLTSHYPNSRGVKRTLSTDNDKEPVERRVSIRHSESAFKYKEIVVKKCQNYTQIWLFSQTKRKNALNPKVFQELITAFHNAKFDDTRVVLLTGSGRIFCSGIDLNYLVSGDRKVAACQMVDTLREFIKTLITFPKPIVAAVNGPAVGLGVAILPLCDIIYASDKASFYCPYTKLGQTPEGCASYTFTQAMGLAMANELLLAGRKITALEAYQIGLVSQVFWPTSMMQEVVPRLQQMANTSAMALEASKSLIRGPLCGKLQMTVETECQMLCDLWSSSECLRTITAYIDEDEDMML